MLHACVERFDVMGERKNILGWDGEVNKALLIFFLHLWNIKRKIVSIGKKTCFMERRGKLLHRKEKCRTSCSVEKKKGSRKKEKCSIITRRQNLNLTCLVLEIQF
jgi:hypothetical protein